MQWLTGELLYLHKTSTPYAWFIQTQKWHFSLRLNTCTYVYMVKCKFVD